ncbi:hypothetical protein TcWFU_008994 [Taenia crassiceps]|uniref:Uncharacterized protein n=1 Tax=Taenia crassiceps TaxID=6207 RepID=A0ABR4Q2F9_9CEST
MARQSHLIFGRNANEDVLSEVGSMLCLERCNTGPFVSPYWIVSINRENFGFVRLGLWEVCFDNFIFAGDYISKAYNGCWYVFRQEFKYIRFWINPPWFIFIQVTSVVNIVFSLGSLLLILQNAAGIETKFCKLSNTPIIFLQSVVVACLTVITIMMGLVSKDRMWLPFSDRNTVGWGLGFAATGGILTLLSIFCLIVDQLAHCSELIYYKLLEEGGFIPAQSMPPDFTSGVGELPTRAIPPGASAIGAASESKLGEVPSLFLTASLPSVAGSMRSGSRNGRAGPVARISSALGSAKGALLARYGETRTTIPGMSLRPEVPATSGALASAKLRRNLQSERSTVPVSTAGAVGAQSLNYSSHSLSLSGKQEKPVIVYGTSQGTILKDSAV